MARIFFRAATVIETSEERGDKMLGVLLVIAVALLLFGIIGGVAISKFLFFLLLVAGVIFLIGLLTRSTA
jgi:hypothetical protein